MPAPSPTAAVAQLMSDGKERTCAEIQDACFPRDNDGRQARWIVQRLCESNFLRVSRKPTKRVPAAYTVRARD